MNGASGYLWDLDIYVYYYCYFKPLSFSSILAKPRRPYCAYVTNQINSTCQMKFYPALGKCSVRILKWELHELTALVPSCRTKTLLGSSNQVYLETWNLLTLLSPMWQARARNIWFNYLPWCISIYGPRMYVKVLLSRPFARWRCVTTTIPERFAGILYVLALV